jgi:HK97 family phage major capsid protein
VPLPKPKAKNNSKRLNARYYTDLQKSDPAAFAAEMEKFRRTRKLEHPLERMIQLTRESVDVPNRKVTFSFSSETPVERWGWVEVLGHQPGEMDTSRLEASAPFLMDHDWDDQRGVVIPQSFQIRDGKGYVECLISRSTQGEDLLQDMADGIRVNISVGYTVGEWKDVTPADAPRDTMPTYRAVSWLPYEVSSVAVPADLEVGLGRSLPTTTPSTIKEFTMNEKKYRALIARREAGEELTQDELSSITAFEAGQRSAQPTAAPVTAAVQASAAEAGTRAVEAERARVAAIRAIAEQYPGNTRVAELCRKAEKEGMEHRDAALEVLAILGKAQKLDISGGDAREMGLGMKDKDIRRFSVRKAIMQNLKGGLDGIEREVHDEMVSRGMASKNDGVLVPFEVLAASTRAMTAGSFSAGGATVSTQPMDFVELLRNRTKVVGAGAQMLTGLKGDIYLPRQTGASTMYYISEGSSVTESDLTVGQIHLRPNTAGVRTEFSRQLLMQSDPSIDGLISRDQMAVIGIGMDLAALKGTGVNGQPLGLFNTTGVGSQSVSSATWANIVSFETKVAQANADGNTMRWLANPAGRGTLKTRTQVSGGTTPPFIWDNDQVIGYDADVTNQLASTDIAFGDWSQLIIAQWGPGVELKLVEFPTNYAAGNMELLSFLSFDVAVRQVGAFCVGTNLS